MHYFIIRLFQASTCFEHMCSSSGGQKLCYTVSGTITPIGGCPCTEQPPIGDDEHMCSKHVEADDQHMCWKHVEA